LNCTELSAWRLCWPPALHSVRVYTCKGLWASCSFVR